MKLYGRERRDERQKEAESRRKARAKRSAATQLKRLTKGGYAAVRERTRLKEQQRKERKK